SAPPARSNGAAASRLASRSTWRSRSDDDRSERSIIGISMRRSGSITWTGEPPRTSNLVRRLSCLRTTSLRLRSSAPTSSAPRSLAVRDRLDLLDEEILHDRGQRGDRGALEEPAQRQVDLEGQSHARDHLRRQQRITAQLEEVVRGADALSAEQLGPDRGDRL